MGTSANVAQYNDPIIEEGLNGQWFGAGHGPVNVSGGSSFKLLIRNPVGSGILTMIHRFRVEVNSSDEYAVAMFAPTTNLPTTPLVSANSRIGYPNGLSQVLWGTGPTMSGGSPFTFQLRVIQDELTEYRILPTSILQPGASIGLSITNTAGGSAQFAAVFDWREIALR